MKRSVELGLELEKRILPRGLIGLSNEYLASYFLLKQGNTDSTKLIRPKYFLLSHSLELALKSVLRANNVTSKELMDDYKHDLNKSLLESIKFVPDLVSKEDIYYINMINEPYKNKMLEYSQIGVKEYPELSILELITVNVNTKVNTLINIIPPVNLFTKI